MLEVTDRHQRTVRAALQLYKLAMHVLKRGGFQCRLRRQKSSEPTDSFGSTAGTPGSDRLARDLTYAVACQSAVGRLHPDPARSGSSRRSASCRLKESQQVAVDGDGGCSGSPEQHKRGAQTTRILPRSGTLLGIPVQRAPHFLLAIPRTQSPKSCGEAMPVSMLLRAQRSGREN